MSDTAYDLLVIGGGAAGFFTAIRCKQMASNLKVAIIERSEKVLTKVRISGGGRCNVTHACFEPSDLVTHYPRGEKELLGPFHHFMTGDMIAWLADHGVETKIEEDGRVFPVSDDSDTIVQCFTGLVDQLGIELRKSCGIRSMARKRQTWQIDAACGKLTAKHVMVCTGSNAAVWRMLENMGINIVPPVPSLFTFNIQHHLLYGLAGISLPLAKVKLKTEKPIETKGPMLITHWGLSGPAVLKASAIGARQLHAFEYRFHIVVNWCGTGKAEVLETFNQLRAKEGHRKVMAGALFQIPRRLWQRLVAASGNEGANWADLSRQNLELLASVLTGTVLPVNGKSTFKEEFVTAGGVDTGEINFTTMEHKSLQGLYFAGEVLNIDAVTGGFNFQAAWTTAEIAARAITNKDHST